MTRPKLTVYVLKRDIEVKKVPKLSQFEYVCVSVDGSWSGRGRRGGSVTESVGEWS
jgi:hypothetical protein